MPKLDKGGVELYERREVVKMVIFELDKTMAEMRPNIIKQHHRVKSELRNVAHEIQTLTSKTALKVVTLQETSVVKIHDDTTRADCIIWVAECDVHLGNLDDWAGVSTVLKIIALGYSGPDHGQGHTNYG